MISNIEYKKDNPSFSDQLWKLFNIMPRNFTFQVTEDCNLKCTYCYQINKSCHGMDFETAKLYCDMILAGTAPYILDKDNKYPQGAVIEFIGGEPLLQIDLISQICDYLITEMIKQNHPWLFRFRFSISSNGTLYFTPKVQEFIKKFAPWLSLNITMDGNKELHDSCRLFEDGSGSYDIVKKAVEHHKQNWDTHMGTKLTIAPENIEFLYDAIVNFIEMGFTCIHLNCVFEKGWELHHATLLYEQLKMLADYILEHNLFDKVFLSIFEERMFYKLPEEETGNWCGGNGEMLALDWKGDYYPCIRYMESSLGKNITPLKIGNIHKGIGTIEEEQKIIDELKSITRQSQSTDECLNCPIGAGCAWCSGYNYQDSGSANHRATYICVMHKARSLANAYFFNSAYLYYNIPKRFEINLPKEEAIKIISEEEYDKLKFLEELTLDETRFNFDSIMDYFKEITGE